MKGALIIRADANSQIGAGHIMRCLALAQAWQDDGGRCVFVVATDAGSVFERLEQEHMELVKIKTVPGSTEDAAMTTQIAARANGRWVILDGYHFSNGYQKKIKDAGLKLMVIDDNCEQKYYYADLILNQNIHAAGSLYPDDTREPYTTLLLGTRYVLLRREFLKYAGLRRKIPPKACNLLVTMGGSDTDNITCKIIESLKRLNAPELNIKIVIGATNPHRNEAETAAALLPGLNEVICNTQDMPKLMEWADLAICAAGSTVWELCFMGLPAILIVVAENQAYLAEKLLETGTFNGFNRYPSISELSEKIKICISDSSLRQKMSFSGIELVDGEGAKTISSLLGQGDVHHG